MNGRSARRWLTGIAQAAVAIAASTLVAIAVTAALGKPPLAVVSTLAEGALGDPYRFADALGRACPLLLCGLAVTIAFRCREWNIGVEGQYLCGAIAATAVGVSCTSWPAWVLVPAMLGSSMAAGALFAVPAVLLETRRAVPLVLSTILLNFVAVAGVAYLTQGPMQGSDPSEPQSDPIAPQAYLSTLVRGTDLHWGVLLGLAAAVAMWFLLSRTSAGLAIRIVGENPRAARWAGVPEERVRLNVMALSGGLGGLAGGLQIAGVNHLLNIAASEEFGYVGIAVALLGRLNPIGVVIAAVLLGMLDVAALHLERQPQLGVPADVAQVIKGLLLMMVLVMGGPRVHRWMSRRRPGSVVPAQEAGA